MIHDLTPTPMATHAVTTSVFPPTAANILPTATPLAAATAPSPAPPQATKTIKALGVKAALAAPTNPLMAQYVRDMQVAGLAQSTQHTYLEAVQRFIQATWVAPSAATEADFQSYLIALRAREVAGQTFRVQRFALQFLFETTLRHDWPLFKKN